jgi:hypothetical protein
MHLPPGLPPFYDFGNDFVPARAANRKVQESADQYAVGHGSLALHPDHQD